MCCFFKVNKGKKFPSIKVNTCAVLDASSRRTDQKTKTIIHLLTKQASQLIHVYAMIESATNKVFHLTIIWSIDSIFSLFLHMLIKSKYFIASRDVSPSRKNFNKRPCVPCITSKHCSSALSSCSLLNSNASISGSTSTSSSMKCCLHRA